MDSAARQSRKSNPTPKGSEDRVKNLSERLAREREQLSSVNADLRREREVSEVIMRNTRAHLAYLDRDFNFIKVNSTYAEGSGHSEAELTGKNHFDLFPNKENQALFEKVRDTGEPIEFRAKPFEFVDQPERGVTYWDWTLSPVKDAAGRVEGLVLSLMDVTDRIRAEQAVNASERKYHQLVDNLNEGVWALDEDACTTFVNPRMAEILGYTIDEMLGRQLFSFMDERAVKIAKYYLRRRQAGMAERHDFELLNKMGERVLTTMATSPITDSDGRYVGALAAVADVTEHRAADEALRSSEERYRLLAENATDAIYRYRLTPTPGYEYMSPGIKNVMGYEPDDFYSDPDIDRKVVHPDDWSVFESMRRSPGAFSGSIILRCVRKDGTLIWIEHHHTPIYVEGRVTAVIGIGHDISERIRAMEELEKMRNEFLGMVTHELKTPLAAIKGAAATVLGSAHAFDPEETRELFQIIDEQADRLRDLTDNLLDMSRIEAGTLSIKPEPMNLRAAIDEARQIFARSGRSQELRIEFPESMRSVNGDKRRILQVMTNLLNNASKFSSPSTPIRVEVERDDVLATVHVHDQGQGIAPEKLPYLFQKFSQVHDSNHSRAAGTGLGLAICKGIVEAHGGRIWAESEGEGKGATFSFTLPLSAVPAQATPSPSGGPTVRRGDRQRVLAVDDDLAILRYLQHSLDSAGYQSLVTSDPTQVTKLVEMEQPDLILLDLRLPEISGFDLLKRIREFSDTPIIFLTASDRSEDTIRALKMGADDYVTKPFSPTELLARIEATLRRRAALGESEPKAPFKLKDLSLNFVERRVTLGGREVSLSATEYKLLCELATHAGLVMTFDQILQRVWGAEYADETELVRSFIRNLRRKLEDDAKQPRYIVTERQIGYRMLRE